MSCDPNSLMAGSTCIDQQIPDGMKPAVLIYLMAQIAKASTDPGTLMANAKCIEATIPKGMQMPVLISLACQIAGV